MNPIQATITSKGQVTIPSYVREKLHLVSGNKLEFVLGYNFFVVIPKNKSIKDLKGILPKQEKVFSIEEMNEAIQEGYGRNRH